MTDARCPASPTPDGGNQHAWVTPVVQVPPDTNYRRFAYVVRGQIVRPAEVFCRWCGVRAPVGEGEV